jgi:short-subunit dehydrogenase
MKLTHHFARDMRGRGFGRVLNIASTAGMQPGPFMATYYASKAFVISFSQALAFELRGSGVTVTCHCPGATATNFAATAGTARSRLFKRKGVADARAVALHAYRAMQAGRVLAVHGAVNKVLTQALRVSPRAAATRIAAGLNQP